MPSVPSIPTPFLTKQNILSAEGSEPTLYTLDYLKGNQKISKIFRFPAALTFPEIVDYCKRYCGENNLRFIWVEVTINIMPYFITA